MAVFVRFNQFVADLCNGGNLNLSSDALKLGLTGTTPVNTDTDVNTSLSPDQLVGSAAVEIAAGNGYTEGGAAVTVTTASQAAGTYTLAANQVVFTGGPAAMTAFRYLYLYDNTAGAAATRPVIGWWDYASSLTLNNGDTLTVKFNNANPGTILTITSP